MCASTTPCPAAPQSADAAIELLDQLREGVAVCDAAGRLVVWNAAAEALTGWTEAQAQTLLPCDLSDGCQLLNERWIDVRRVTLADPPRAVTLLQDAHADALLAAKTREQEAFIYTVSHDLRSPLVSIQGMAGLLAEDYAAQLDADAQHFIARIVSNIGRMNAMLDELLTLSRIGTVELEREPVELGLLWELALRQVEPLARARHAELVAQTPLPPVLANPTRLVQVLQQLLENAVQYTPLGRTPVAQIAAFERGADWEIVVSDQGIGVPEEFRHKIFDIFQRLPDAKHLRPDGSGVGLAIVKRVVETHGGQLWVTDAPGGGAAFHFTLPMLTRP